MIFRANLFNTKSDEWDEWPSSQTLFWVRNKIDFPCHSDSKRNAQRKAPQNCWSISEEKRVEAWIIVLPRRKVLWRVLGFQKTIGGPWVSWVWESGKDGGKLQGSGKESVVCLDWGVCHSIDIHGGFSSPDWGSLLHLFSCMSLLSLCKLIL